jgi:uncharacterized protein (DUF2336 family)
MAEDIFRLMVRDVEIQVREALSAQLKSCPDLAHDVARALADDVESVALPVIRHSSVLTEEDLIEIVQAQGSAKRVTVAQRDDVPESVSDALVDTKDEAAVAALAANPGAQISESTMGKALDAFGTSENVTAPLAHRTVLPMRIAERLVNLVSDRLKEHLLVHHGVSDTYASDIVEQSREQATLGLLRGGLDYSDQVQELVAALHANGRLTTSIVLRALFTGNMAFFEAALARLAGISVLNASKLIEDEGPMGLTALLKQAGIPDKLYPAIRAGVTVCRETEYDGGENDRERFLCRVVERVITGFESPAAAAAIGEDNLDYLLAKLRRFGPVAHRGA